MIGRLSQLAFVAIALLVTAVPSAAANTPSPSAAVLHQEARWLAALLAGDRATIATLLAAGYKHIDSRGRLYDRTQELASITKEPIVMKWSNQTIDFAGDVAIVHGINTSTASEKTTRERYTDVYIKQNNTWKALSAQETTLTP